MSQNLPIDNPLSGLPGPPFLGDQQPTDSAGTVTISSSELQTESGTRVIGPLAIALAMVASDAVYSFTGPGPWSFTAPPGATVMVIRPPAANVVGLALGTVAISPSNPSLISLPPSTVGTGYLLTPAAAVTGNVEVSFA